MMNSYSKDNPAFNLLKDEVELLPDDIAPDKASNHDTFGSLRIVNTLKTIVISHIETLKDEHDEPSAIIGLFGRWGEGKSTVLETLRDRLSKREPPIGVFFLDVWRYSDKEILWFFEKIFQREMMANSFWGRCKLLFYALFSIKMPSELKAALASGLQYDLVTSATRDTSYGSGLWSGIKIFIKGTNAAKADVICIDNLDRCIAEQQYAALHAIYKHRYEIKKPVIVAIDPSPILCAKNFSEPPSEFIRKIFTLTISLNPKRSEDIHAYVNTKVEYFFTQPVFLHESFNKHDREQFCGLISMMLRPSPRRINRLLNSVFTSYMHLRDKQNSIAILRLPACLYCKMNGLSFINLFKENLFF